MKTPNLAEEPTKRLELILCGGQILWISAEVAPEKLVIDNG